MWGPSGSVAYNCFNMKSGKEKRNEIKAKRFRKVKKIEDEQKRVARLARIEELKGKTLVNPLLLAPTR